jgi:signal transduction histidine kinase
MTFRRADLAWVPLLVASAGLSFTAALTFDGGGWLVAPMALLAYPAGRRMTSLPVALWVFAAVTCAGLVLASRQPAPLSAWFSVVFLEFTASVLPWWAGRYRRLRAEQHERERGIVADQARLRERARIARDMHDALGHELALIALHGGALELAAGVPDEQRRAAGEVRACAVRATLRLHEIVDVLGSADAATDLRPVDESIDDLVRRAAAAGLSVRLRQDGPAPSWSPAVRQAAHRVVQESLTNATRYAPGAPVTVTLGRRDEATLIEIANTAATHPSGAQGTGQGLIGLDERVRLAGGRLTAGTRPDGGWTVTAVLPDDGVMADTPVVELGNSRRETRRHLVRTTALPVGGGLALIALLAVTQGLAATRRGLADDRYDELRLGQSRAAVERLLPAHDVGGVPRVIASPPRPAGAACVYYEAGDGLLDVGPAVYQLCFAGDVLVSKNRLERA